MNKVESHTAIESNNHDKQEEIYCSGIMLLGPDGSWNFERLVINKEGRYNVHDSKGRRQKRNGDSAWEKELFPLSGSYYNILYIQIFGVIKI